MHPDAFTHICLSAIPMANIKFLAPQPPPVLCIDYTMENTPTFPALATVYPPLDAFVAINYV